MAKKKGSANRLVKEHKSGRSAKPAAASKMTTTKEDRARGRWLHNLGFTKFFPPLHEDKPAFSMGGV